MSATLIGSRDRVTNGIAQNTVLRFSKNHPHVGPQVSLLSCVTHIAGFSHAEPQLLSKKSSYSSDAHIDGPTILTATKMFFWIT